LEKKEEKPPGHKKGKTNYRGVLKKPLLKTNKSLWGNTKSGTVPFLTPVEGKVRPKLPAKNGGKQGAKKSRGAGFCWFPLGGADGTGVAGQ